MLISFHRNQFPSPCISLNSTTLELLEWIKNKVNAGTIKGKKRAQTILNEYKNVTPRNGRYSEEDLKNKEEFYERFMDIK